MLYLLFGINVLFTLGIFFFLRFVIFQRLEEYKAPILRSRELIRANKHEIEENTKSNRDTMNVVEAHAKSVTNNIREIANNIIKLSKTFNETTQDYVHFKQETNKFAEMVIKYVSKKESLGNEFTGKIEKTEGKPN